jgi:hypothetical protein
MQSRRDPRAEPDDPDSESDREERYVPRSESLHPESVKRRTSAPPRPHPDARPEAAGFVETSDLVELPLEQVTAYARARPPLESAPGVGGVRASPPSSEGKVRAKPPPPSGSIARPVANQRPIEGPEEQPFQRAPSSVTNQDPRLEQIEPIIDEGNWHTVGKQLGSLEETGRLPPTLGLIAAVAHTEIAGDAGCPEASDLAIRCMTGVFGIQSDSPIGRVLAKRLLRRNQRAAPEQATVPAATAFVLFAIFLAVGLVGGYLIGSGTLRVHF